MVELASLRGGKTMQQNKPLHRSRDQAVLDARVVSGCGSMNGDVMQEKP
jgi:hypothetical protein